MFGEYHVVVDSQDRPQSFWVRLIREGDQVSWKVAEDLSEATLFRDRSIAEDLIKRTPGSMGMLRTIPIRVEAINDGI